MILEQILDNTPIWVAALAWAIAQGAKIIITFIGEKKFDITRAYGSGGMPSSHSALVTALAVSIGRKFGFDTPSFAVSVIMALIVMYDAAGVRRAAGQQAAAINKLFSHSGMKLEEQLKELLGHTPLQVFAGAILGLVIACVIEI